MRFALGVHQHIHGHVLFPISFFPAHVGSPLALCINSTSRRISRSSSGIKNEGLQSQGSLNSLARAKRTSPCRIVFSRNSNLYA
jgi:hypothetical protein